MTDREMAMHDSLDNAIRGAIEMRVELERLRAIETAARTLRDKLKVIHNDPAFASVWFINQLHGGPYRGPTYTMEFAELERTLDGVPSAKASR